MQLSKNGLSCHLFAVLEASLDDSASIGMNTQVLNLTSKCLEHKRYVVSMASLDGLLDNVVSVLILDASQDILFQFAHKRRLLIVEYMLESLTGLVSGDKTEIDHGTNLLYNTTTIHLERQVQDTSLHLVGQNLLLVLIAMLEELLNDIVSEDISHKLNGVWLYLPEKTLFLVAIGCLQLLLYES